MPTAHPMMTPRLELEPPPEPESPEFEPTPAALAVGSIDGVTRIDLMMVETPPGPEETLVTSEENGVADADGVVRDGGGPDDDAGAFVLDAEALPEPVARPVKDASVGALDAWLRPMVAYGLPS
jgi:hypothetical protein